MKRIIGEEVVNIYIRRINGLVEEASAYSPNIIVARFAKGSAKSGSYKGESMAEKEGTLATARYMYFRIIREY